MTYYALKSDSFDPGMLKVQFKDQRRQPFWVMEDVFSVGSGSENNLVLNDQSILDVHACFLSQGDGFIIKAVSNDASLKVNGIAIEQININCGDEIKIGNVALEVVDPLDNTKNSAAPYWSLIADSSWLSGQEFPLQALPGTKITLGRGSRSDIVFAGTHLSRQHAEIEMGESSLKIRDLGSANGTYVNDKRIEAANLKAGDKLRLDVYSFRVFGPGMDIPSSTRTERFRAVTDEDLNKALSISRRNWKTRPTSPGNRVEPEEKQGMLFTWISGAVILAMFITAVVMVIGF